MSLLSLNIFRLLLFSKYIIKMYDWNFFLNISNYTQRSFKITNNFINIQPENLNSVIPVYIVNLTQTMYSYNKPISNPCSY